MNPGGPKWTVVIPTTGRESLHTLLAALQPEVGKGEIIVVDDRPAGKPLDLPVRVLHCGGRGPAAARNLGWRAADTEWIAFLDDDVVPTPGWADQLAADLAQLGSGIGGSQGRIEVPLPEDRRPTDDERGTAGLATASWITADMAYRRDALVAVGGFDERFPRAFREDADLALRVRRAGYRLVRGERVTVHPARRSDFFASLRAQRGNADNALMRAKFGGSWRRLSGEGPGRMGRHLLATGLLGATAGLLAAGRARWAAAAATAWGALTAEFAIRRILPGPRTPDEIARMVLTSALIPPAAITHRVRGELRFRRAARGPEAILFDRDDTLIADVPYLSDATQVRPMPGAAEVLRRLRAGGVRVGVVSNQSGVAHGLISAEQLAEVNAKVDQLLGPFDTWQVCVHRDADHCACRKPNPGLVWQAARELGVDPSRCVVIGDIGSDVRAALAAGARAVLVPTGKTRPEEVEHARRHAAVAESLGEAVELALAGTHR